MREILFRGKRVIDGKWVESCCPLGEMHSGTITYDFDSKTVCQYTGLDDNTKWEQLSEDEKEKFLSEWNYKENRQNVKEDWNGRKIFEGDIVECVCNGNMNIRLIVWDNDELDFKGTNGKEHYKTNFDYLPCCEELVVIGNIFDNSELLEGGK